MYLRLFKPLGDISVSLLGLPFLALLITVFAPLIAIELKTVSVFFIQKRPGLNLKLFPLIKLRTLKPDGKAGPIGGFLRSSSLDEVPQILNILFGQMSWVGPRPLVKDYVPLYSEQEKVRFLVKPGITGLAQINGRNAISWQQKFAFDIKYVNGVTPTLDILILLKTPAVLLGLYSSQLKGDLPMEAFRGSK